MKAAHKDHEIKSPLIIMIPRNLIISKIKYFLLRFLHTVSTTYTQFQRSNSTTCCFIRDELRNIFVYILVEKRIDPNGRVYFVNHKNRTTQWEDPRTQG